MRSYEFRHVRGHIEVYYLGVFLLSADNMSEAYAELREREEEANE